MQKSNIKKVLLLGSGGLRIGQAGEFDYSGSQAIKALKEEGISVILLNPNIATIQTDPGMADKVYLQPLNIQTATRIIEQDKPDAILLSFGGQTALNLGLALEESGVLARNNVQVLGTSVESIQLSEDRALFKAELDKLGVCSADSYGCTTLEEAIVAAEKVKYPLMMRSAFSLGGLGSGIIKDEAHLRERVGEALSQVPQVLIEENLIGWSEFEYEIIRDKSGNALTVCNMENFDAMGVHTGESIVVSPSQSLNNNEYHMLREVARKVANHFNIIGECNIQYAFNLKTGEYRIIEINPRLSRSSALASKATGYPLAFIAAKLGLGYHLHELTNMVTQKTVAYFEPALDYIVVKIPRWDIHKLKGAQRRIGTEMKSVGEVMAIGRTFCEALQKAIGMLNIGASCIADYPFDIPKLKNEIEFATDRRVFAIYRYFLEGHSIDEVNKLSHIDKWFLNHVKRLADYELTLRESELIESLLHEGKKLGFSDKAIGLIKKIPEQDVRALRLKYKITPVVKQIDTLAGEFDAQTNYLYMTYHGQFHDVKPSEKKSTIILGSGPYSIGSSVEFDWGAVTTSRTLRELGESPIIINSNPETVSTDYDESDRLYFEQLSFERVQDIAECENLKGIVVSVGGQIANNLVNPLSDAGFPILGTEPKNIDRAEDREKFSSMLNDMGIDQPQWIAASTIQKAKEFAKRVGYPVLIRPSFVLSGAAMNVVSSDKALELYLAEATSVSPDHPVVVSDFIEGAKELEMDGVAKNGQVVVQAISEHVENAGVHSGDATIVLPPQKLYLETIRKAKSIARKIVKALEITGPFNIQFLAKNNNLKVIECNLRASRSFPFVSKVTKHNFIEIATKVMLNHPVSDNYETLEMDYVGIKTPQFSYSRLKGSNPVAGVEMASTGEVACLGENLQDAFYRSWLSTEQQVKGKRIFVSVGDENKSKLCGVLKTLDDAGWELVTTSGTHDYLAKEGIASRCVHKVAEAVEPNAGTVIIKHEVDLVVNIPGKKAVGDQVTDGFKLRRLAIDHHVPLVTNLQSAQLMLECLATLDMDSAPVKAWSEFEKVSG